jgi:hypothetical protein
MFFNLQYNTVLVEEVVGWGIFLLQILLESHYTLLKSRAEHQPKEG